MSREKKKETQKDVEQGETNTIVFMSIELNFLSLPLSLLSLIDSGFSEISASLLSSES